MVSIHIEADPHAHRTLAAIRAAGGLAGIVINPATALSALDEVIKFADYVLVMSVNPGFGGQEFIPESLDKVRRLRKMIDERRLNTRIEIDGGINVENIAEVTSAGAEIIVAGSAIFGAEDPSVALRALREATVLWV
jgi:ribulose-phosphate 3-epimerase